MLTQADENTSEDAAACLTQDPLAFQPPDDRTSRSNHAQRPAMNVTQEFEPLYRAAMALASAHGTTEAALVTITHTHGSTFRRAGASMLVLRDGRLICELSGGCPQRDIALRAQQVMDSDQPALVAYGRDSNYDVMIETGCGGELQVFIEPLRHSQDLGFLEAVARLRASRRRGTLVTFYAVDGIPLSHRPQRLLRSTEDLWNDIADHALRQLIDSELESIPAGTTASSRQVTLHGNTCELLFESLGPPHSLIIIGDNAGARMLATLSLQLGWETTLVDASQSMANLPDGARHVVTPPSLLSSRLTLDGTTSAVVMTHRLERDIAYLGALLETPVSYLGVIGSRQRATQIRAAFPHANGRLHMPAGLDIGSETPQEIAVAIAAEILALHNGRHGGHLSHTQNPIHP
jgi:xanthine/CO dehydrogenase XdhC/CoxF family maturation factor